MKNNNTIHRKNTNSEFTLGRVIELILNNWYIFLVGILLAIGCGFMYVRYGSSTYSAKATVIIKDIHSGSSSLSSNVVLEEFDIFKFSKKVDTEMEVLKSRTLLRDAIIKLDLNKRYFAAGEIKTVELYKKSPFKVDIYSIDDSLYYKDFHINLKKDYFSVRTKDEVIAEKGNYGKKIVNSKIKFKVQKTDNKIQPENIVKQYFFQIHKPNEMAEKYREKLDVLKVNDYASMLEIVLKDNVAERTSDLVNALADVYIDQGVEEKTKVASKTIEFLNNSLEDIEKKLIETEEMLEKFKRDKGVINLEYETALSTEKLVAMDIDEAKLSMNVILLDSLKRRLENNNMLSSFSPISTLDINEPILIEQILNIIELESELIKLEEFTNKNNPNVRALANEVKLKKSNLLKTVESIESTYRQKAKNLRNSIADYERKVFGKIPSSTKDFIRLKRNFQLSEDIYIFLLQKRYESDIAKAATVSDNNILDYALIPKEPIEPRTKLIYIVSVIMGISFASIFTVVKEYINNKVKSKIDLENLSDIPLFGIIGHSDEKDSLVLMRNPKSAVSESFRSVRTNLQYLGGLKKTKTVLITSTVSQEGKSFCALNLATSLSIANHKTLLMELDLRKPKLHKELDINKENGITKILVGQSTLEDSICKTDIENLDFLPAGIIPPNPSEIILSKQFAELIGTLKEQYEYLIMDTPPIGLVTDAEDLMKFSDINIYVVRQNFTRKESIQFANEINSRSHVSNLGFLLNDAKFTSKYSAYQYGWYKSEYGTYNA